MRFVAIMSDVQLVAAPFEWWMFAGIIGGSLAISLYAFAVAVSCYRHATNNVNLIRGNWKGFHRTVFYDMQQHEMSPEEAAHVARKQAAMKSNPLNGMGGYSSTDSNIKMQGAPAVNGWMEENGSSSASSSFRRKSVLHASASSDRQAGMSGNEVQYLGGEANQYDDVYAADGSTLYAQQMHAPEASINSQMRYGNSMRSTGGGGGHASALPPPLQEEAIANSQTGQPTGMNRSFGASMRNGSARKSVTYAPQDNVVEGRRPSVSPRSISWFPPVEEAMPNSILKAPRPDSSVNAGEGTHYDDGEDSQEELDEVVPFADDE